MHALIRAIPALGLVVLLQALLPMSMLADRPPNILIILTDDQGYGDLSLHGNPFILTPHLDRIGLEGVRFDRFYVNSVCAPTRAALLTGRYPLRTGTHGVTNNREAMRAGEVTFGDAFQQAGYRTSFIGKWHNGSQYPNTPPGKGFDEFFGFYGGHINDYFDARLIRGTTAVPTTGYVTDVLTNEAMRFIESNRHRPFLCYLNFNAPHDPYQVPDYYFDPIRARGLEPAAAAHFAMCKNIDDNVGRLLGHLERLGIADNTMVVFLTDNGAAGRAAQYYNAEMRGWKTSTHEGGTRVPLFIRWPAADWRPGAIEELAEHVDFYPTLADLAGVSMAEGPAVDGISLRPLIEGKAGDWPERILFTHNPLDETNRYPGAVRTPRYRLVCRIDGPQAGSQASNRDETRSDWMLFDMRYDPGETTNIAAKHPDLVKELAALYEEWIDDVSSKGLRRWPIEVGHNAHNPVVLNASQAFFKAPVGYQVGGFAHDWLTHWSDLSGEISFELDVQQAGYYELEIAYTCEPEDAGSTLVVAAGEASATVTVPAFAAVDIELPNRDEASNIRYRNREWGKLPIGKILLPEGEITIRMQAQSIAGGSVMDFKHLSLELQ